MMAGPNKKLKVVHVSAEQDDSNDHKLQKFLGWCHDNHFNINKKVRVGRHGSCSEYGMIAVGDLDEAECLFEIPRNVLLNVENSCVADIIQSESHRLESNSGWVTIILALMYEYTNPTSLWRPYLDACPDFNVLDHPMFWT
ncbi:N-lysine methyltransferase setd6-like, partial [Saccoglossus kowalevskii]